jgi:diguanylate cyclase (GGDEF)-like protein/PAS domain S-box-containing protein
MMRQPKTIKYTILFGFLPALVLIGGLTLLARHSMSAINEKIAVITEQHNRKTELIQGMRNVVQQRSLSMHAMLHMTDLFEREEEFLRFKDLAEQFSIYRRELSRLALTNQQRRLLADALSIIQVTQPLQVSIVDNIVGEVMTKATYADLRRDLPLETRLVGLFDRLIDIERVDTAVAVQAARAEYQFASIFMAVLGGGAVTIMAIVALLVIRRTGVVESDLYQEKEQAEITLHSIGEGVITTDAEMNVVYMNPIAEQLTALRTEEAFGKPLSSVYQLLDEKTRAPLAMPDRFGMSNAVGHGRQKGKLMISQLGNEYAIEDSFAPIRNGANETVGGVLVFRDVTEARKLSRQLSWQASHDGLTGLTNRLEFEILLSNLLGSAKAQNKNHALLYMDLDQFKVVNDTCGHVAGDELLKKLALIISPAIRDSDTLARLGGDEFGVLLEGCPLEGARNIANEILGIIQDFRFVWKDHTFNIGVSIGLVSIDGESEDVAAVLSAADAACYLAKEKGRNRVWVHQHDDEELVHRRGEMQWISQLTAALENDRFVMYKQMISPVDETHAGSETYELLIRLDDGDGNLISPGAFIPAAERYGLMTRIDHRVVGKAVEWLIGQSVRDGRHENVAINVSSKSVGDEGFLEFVRQQIARNEIDATSLCFEITETGVIENFTQAIKFINTFREMGCRFALDDFGSGMSSFAYLKNLPVDYLKIDGTFIRDMADDPVDHSMVESITRTGHVMGKKIIAEWVETEAVLEKLKALGVDYVQGYLVHKPEPLQVISGLKR